MNIDDDIGAEALAHLLRALPIDVEQHVAPLREHGLDGRARRAVAVAMDLRPFQQFPGQPHRVEFASADEMIMDAVSFARSARPRRHRDGEREVE